jgi:alpha-D-xyloside xylohydrolase
MLSALMSSDSLPSRLGVGAVLLFGLFLPVSARPQEVIGDRPDVSEDFQDLASMYFVAANVVDFDPVTGSGTLQWNRYQRQPGILFNRIEVRLGRAPSDEFPETEYDRDPVLPFRIDFVSPRTVRLRLNTRHVPVEQMRAEPSIMLDGPVPDARAEWTVEESDSAVTYRSEYGSLRLVKDPWHIELYDADGKLLTRTQSLEDPVSISEYVPFSFVRRARDLSRSTAATFSLKPDEHVYGGGESFTRLDKRGQKMLLALRDALGSQGTRQYKAAPVFVTSEGYGMFLHTSAPVTFDFGHDFDGHTTLYSGDELIDLFVFLGEPKDVLTEYTAISGRSPVPPVWSFGLWMSRITYDSEEQVRTVARLLREHEIPADVIHIDTGWFETDWRNDYRFSTSRFDDPAGMIADLREQGFRVSLWQLPYFTSKNPLWEEIVQNGYHVRNEGGVLPFEDAILDFSNPEAVAWYQDKLRGLLEMGVSAIKADFGEEAPMTGLYHSGKSGWYEHNLYPVRYNDAVYQVTREVTGDGIIWGRSAWAGSQRYPVHWGGDAENDGSAMAGSLRAGLSMGLSGFTYWSHDVGGFVERSPRNLYRRWAAFGALTSHTRTHGAPPREPWEYDEAFEADFRRAMELKYALMPYVYAQAVAASSVGHPMMRALFIEYPEDPTSWLIEDEYLFGADLLVAPLFTDEETRRVYLPPGDWIDYQTGQSYSGRTWHEITAGPIPVVLLVRSGAVIPHVGVAQSTAEIDWESVELRVFSADDGPVSGLFSLPGGEAHLLRLVNDGSGYALIDDPYDGDIEWAIRRIAPS